MPAGCCYTARGWEGSGHGNGIGSPPQSHHQDGPHEPRGCGSGRGSGGLVGPSTVYNPSGERALEAGSEPLDPCRGRGLAHVRRGPGPRWPGVGDPGREAGTGLDPPNLGARQVVARDRGRTGLRGVLGRECLCPGPSHGKSDLVLQDRRCSGGAGLRRGGGGLRRGPGRGVVRPGQQRRVPEMEVPDGRPDRGRGQLGPQPAGRRDLDRRGQP